MNRLFCFIILIIVGSVLTSQPAVAQIKPLVLKPSSKWYAHYQDDSCRLVRNFGTEEDIVTAIFSRFGPGDYFKLVLAGKPVKLKRASQPVSLQFGPRENEQKMDFFIGNLGKKPAILLRESMRIAAMTEAQKKASENTDPEDLYGLPLISTERKAAVTYLSIGRPLRTPVTLELGSMKRPFAALSKCIDGLLTRWGIDVEKHKTLSKPAWPASDYRLWIKSRDYPRDMLREGQPALIEFRLSVDQNGKTTACHIQQTTRPKEFDAAVCKSLMKRSQFTPAVDAEGNAIASYWRNTVRFQNP